MQRIIVATDGSPDANCAVDVAARLAQATGASLAIMTAGGHISGAESRRLASSDGDLSEAMISAANKIL
jgi:nucleotide-binding universal stress UspA family protein